MRRLRPQSKTPDQPTRRIQADRRKIRSRLYPPQLSFFYLASSPEPLIADISGDRMERLYFHRFKDIGEEALGYSPHSQRIVLEPNCPAILPRSTIREARLHCLFSRVSVLPRGWPATRHVYTSNKDRKIRQTSVQSCLAENNRRQ